MIKIIEALIATEETYKEKADLMHALPFCGEEIEGKNFCCG